eukprot:451336-Alexandrium_andersonii.AAC.1
MHRVEGDALGPDGPGGVRLKPAPDALHVLLAHADIGGVDEVPAAGAVRVAQGPDAVRMQDELL